MTYVLCLVTVVLLMKSAGCTPPPEAPQPAEGEATGVVEVVGSAPVGVRVVLREEGGGRVGVGGPLTDELRALAGLKVSVVGPEVDRGGLSVRTLRASGYEIIAEEGRPAIVGTVERIAGETVHLRSEGGEVVQVLMPGTPFEVGQKVWVRGPQVLRVETFGVIRR